VWQAWRDRTAGASGSIADYQRAKRPVERNANLGRGLGAFLHAAIELLGNAVGFRTP
jgi:hypothetical protein